MKQVHTLILEIMKEVSALKKTLKLGKNNAVYKKVCKGLSPECFQPAWALSYPELPEGFDLKMNNFPFEQHRSEVFDGERKRQS